MFLGYYLGYEVHRLIIIRRRWINSGFSQRAQNFENVYVMLQKIIEVLTHNQKILWQDFIKFVKDKGSYEVSFCVLPIRIFTKFSDDPYYEPLPWFLITNNLRPLILSPNQLFFIRLDMCMMPTYTTLTFTTKALHFVADVQLLKLLLKQK